MVRNESCCAILTSSSPPQRRHGGSDSPNRRCTARRARASFPPSGSASGRRRRCHHLVEKTALIEVVAGHARTVTFRWRPATSRLLLLPPEQPSDDGAEELLGIWLSHRCRRRRSFVRSGCLAVRSLGHSRRVSARNALCEEREGQYRLPGDG